MRSLAGALTALLLTGSLASAQAPAPTIPALHATALSGAPVDLPQALHGHTAVLILSFSEDARANVTDWFHTFANDYRNSPTVLYYSLPVLAGAPSFLRGMITRKIRESVSAPRPAPLRPHPRPRSRLEVYRRLRQTAPRFRSLPGPRRRLRPNPLPHPRRRPLPASLRRPEAAPRRNQAVKKMLVARCQKEPHEQGSQLTSNNRHLTSSLPPAPNPINHPTRDRKELSRPRPKLLQNQIR